MSKQTIKYVNKKFVLDRNNSVTLNLDQPIELRGNWKLGLKAFSMANNFSLLNEKVVILYVNNQKSELYPTFHSNQNDLDDILKEMFSKRQKRDVVDTILGDDDEEETVIVVEEDEEEQQQEKTESAEKKDKSTVGVGGQEKKNEDEKQKSNLSNEKGSTPALKEKESEQDKKVEEEKKQEGEKETAKSSQTKEEKETEKNEVAKEDLSVPKTEEKEKPKESEKPKENKKTDSVEGKREPEGKSHDTQIEEKYLGKNLVDKPYVLNKPKTIEFTTEGKLEPEPKSHNTEIEEKYLGKNLVDKPYVLNKPKTIEFTNEGQEPIFEKPVAESFVWDDEEDTDSDDDEIAKIVPAPGRPRLPSPPKLPDLDPLPLAPRPISEDPSSEAPINQTVANPNPPGFHKLPSPVKIADLDPLSSDPTPTSEAPTKEPPAISEGQKIEFPSQIERPGSHKIPLLPNLPEIDLSKKPAETKEPSKEEKKNEEVLDFSFAIDDYQPQMPDFEVDYYGFPEMDKFEPKQYPGLVVNYDKIKKDFEDVFEKKEETHFKNQISEVEADSHMPEFVANNFPPDKDHVDQNNASFTTKMINEVLVSDEDLSKLKEYSIYESLNDAVQFSNNTEVGTNVLTRAGFNSVKIEKNDSGKYVVHYDPKYVRAIFISRGFRRALGFAGNGILFNGDISSEKQLPIYSHVTVSAPDLVKPTAGNKLCELAVLKIDGSKESVEADFDNPPFFDIWKNNIQSIKLDFYDYYGTRLIMDQSACYVSLVLKKN